MDDFRNNVKQVMAVFLFLFVALISYIAYFQVFEAPTLAEDSGNRRIAAKKNEVLRGTIYDRNGTALATSEKTGALTQTRTYLGGDLYVHALGYVSDKYGNTQLEKAYDEELTTYKSDLKSFFASDDSEAKIGNGVITTLDPSIQKAAYDALGNKKGAVVALDPTTGEVLAMVSKPSYNPNDLDASMAAANAGSGDDSPLINRAVAGVYPPGSTFKAITATSALENISGIKSKTWNDVGIIEFNDSHSLSNYDNEVNGTINLKNAFVKSSNFVFGNLAMDLGNSKLKATAEKFGFNNQIPATGFTISTSTFPTLGSSEEGMIAQSGIGQSTILATPMQMALVASTIANDGVMMKPTLVKEIVDSTQKTVKTIAAEEYSRVMSKADAATLTDFMSALVDSKTNWSTFSGINAAGKTGTADHTDSNGNLKTPHSWFIGFAPADNPKIAVAVIVEEGGTGASAAAPIAGTVMQAALKK